ncbi:uncharacterized protein LOC100367709 [Saccoglossus kowalevskii]|uniref:Uncharacterized protein LOC100367709 n=1 Tax=Saccoglossus kowalevskii TaxID=10224 RepID=A0ABM0GKU4_SACKO|nr:PREDICTED: uncharacterized protein LOC100367709 [Saccoglossus kowalevskii]
MGRLVACQVVIVVCLLSHVACDIVRDFKWRSCGGLSIEFIEISQPTPDEIRVGVNLQFLHASPAVSIRVDLHRSVYLGMFNTVDVKVPCNNNLFGSCSYEICELVERMTGGGCESDQNTTCSCFSSSHIFNTEFTVKLFSPTVSVLETGNYESTFLFYDDVDREVACLRFKFSLVF